MVSSMRANIEGRKQENRNPHCVQRVYSVPPSYRPRCPVSWVSRGNINPPSSTTHCSQCHVSPPLRWNCSRILALTILLNSVWRGIRGENVRIAIKNFRLINPESGKIFDSIVRASSSQHYDSLSLCGGEWFILWRKSYLSTFTKPPLHLWISIHRHRE